MKQRTRRKPAQSYLKKRWTIDARAAVSSLQRNRAAGPRRDDKSHRMMDKTGAGPGTVVCEGVRVHCTFVSTVCIWALCAKSHEKDNTVMLGFSATHRSPTVVFSCEKCESFTFWANALKISVK